MDTLPLKTKIIAAVSLFLFAVSITVSIVIGSNYRLLAGEYEAVYEEQQQLEQWIYNENSKYYKDIIINGLGGENLGLLNAVYASVKPFYRYRLKINGNTANQGQYPLRQSTCTIIIEEYYLSHAVNYFPKDILEYFKYLNNKGAGGAPTPEESIYDDILKGNLSNQFSILISGCEKQIRRYNEGNTTFIEINISEMVAGSSEINISLSETFMNYFNNDNRFINIWTVI